MMDEKNSNRIFYGVVLAVGLMVSIVYISIAHRSFFFQDDFRTLYNAIYNKPDASDSAPDDFFRPVSRGLYFGLCYKLFGLEPFGYYLFNIAAHLLSAICLFLLLRRLQVLPKISALTALLFFINKTGFEKVYWISNFQHTSYHLFLILAALLALNALEHTGAKRIWQLVMSNTMWVLALLSNNGAVIFPFVLVLLIWLRLQQLDKPNTTYTTIKATSVHWLIMVLYLVFIFIPISRQTADASNPYYMDISWQTIAANLQYYLKEVFIPNARKAWRIPAIILIIYLLVFGLKELKKLFGKPIIHNLSLIIITSAILYAPFAFLKHQRYPNYLGLALIPAYLPVFYLLQKIYRLDLRLNRLKQALVILIALTSIISFLPDKGGLKWYLKHSYQLHMRSAWEETQQALPEIPTGIKKVVFIDQEQFESNETVPLWQIPPFWWFTGLGRMFSILYNRTDIIFTVSGKITPEPATIYIKVTKEGQTYHLSLIK